LISSLLCFSWSATELKDFKQHLPLARIKKIMKSDDDLRTQMISSEVPHLFAKACELFVLDLTLRSWMHTDANRRRTLQVPSASSTRPSFSGTRNLTFLKFGLPCVVNQFSVRLSQSDSANS
jgi:histone H3/H4